MTAIHTLQIHALSFVAHKMIQIQCIRANVDACPMHEPTSITISAHALDLNHFLVTRLMHLLT